MSQVRESIDQSSSSSPFEMDFCDVATSCDHDSKCKPVFTAAAAAKQQQRHTLSIPEQNNVGIFGTKLQHQQQQQQPTEWEQTHNMKRYWSK